MSARGARTAAPGSPRKATGDTIMDIQGSPDPPVRQHEENMSNGQRAPGVGAKRTRQDSEAAVDGGNERESPLPSASTLEALDSDGFESGLMSDEDLSHRGYGSTTDRSTSPGGCVHLFSSSSGEESGSFSQPEWSHSHQLHPDAASLALDDIVEWEEDFEANIPKILRWHNVREVMRGGSHYPRKVTLKPDKELAKEEPDGHPMVNPRALLDRAKEGALAGRRFITIEGNMKTFRSIHRWWNAEFWEGMVPETKSESEEKGSGLKNGSSDGLYESDVSEPTETSSTSSESSESSDSSESSEDSESSGFSESSK
eukprot:evm.model.scf_1701.4 EVM.evm.TU.scf_1701.4   scf_1701:18525-23621(+)